MNYNSYFENSEGGILSDFVDHLTYSFLNGKIDIITILNSLQFTKIDEWNPESGISCREEYCHYHGSVNGIIEMLYVELTPINIKLLSPLFINLNASSNIYPGWTGLSKNIDLLYVIEIAPYLGYGVIHYEKGKFLISNPELYSCTEEDQYPVPLIYSFKIKIEIGCDEYDLPF